MRNLYRFPPGFSRRQQQVIVILCLLFGSWLVYWRQSERSFTTTPRVFVAQPDPPECMFYIDPPVDPNTSDREDLQLLPGIGPVLADRIIAYRERHGPFCSLESLRHVKGIGPKTLHKLRPYLNDAKPAP